VYRCCTAILLIWGKRRKGIVEQTLGAAKSWVAAFTGPTPGALRGALYAFQKLPAPCNAYRVWLRIAVVSAVRSAFRSFPGIAKRRRKDRLKSIAGEVRPGYFQLAPQEDKGSFARADGAQERILR
jgi:hypothetical protein